MAGDRGGVELSDPALPRAAPWLNRGERVIYDSAWVQLVIADVLMPDGTQVDHHVVRMPREAAGTIIVRDGRVLLMYRHRFITDTWGWEIPAGAVDEDESIEAGAIREALEESGWEPQTLAPLCRFFPANGVLGQTFHIFVSRRRGAPRRADGHQRVDTDRVVHAGRGPRVASRRRDHRRPELRRP